MKHRDLIKQIEQSECRLIRHGGKHDWYQNPVAGMAQPVSRHREVNEHLTRSILKKLAD